jgi:hypothetical protein
MREWDLLFNINKDGVSMNTFYQKTKEYKATVIVIEESNGTVFGGYASHKWHSSKYFYGSGETFLFSFKVYLCFIWRFFSYLDLYASFFYYRTLSGLKFIIGLLRMSIFCSVMPIPLLLVEGKTQFYLLLYFGREQFGLCIEDDFGKGKSGKSSTFDNEVLSTNKDFMIKNFEVKFCLFQFG